MQSRPNRLILSWCGVTMIENLFSSDEWNESKVKSRSFNPPMTSSAAYSFYKVPCCQSLVHGECAQHYCMLQLENLLYPTSAPQHQGISNGGSSLQLFPSIIFIENNVEKRADAESTNTLCHLNNV